MAEEAKKEKVELNPFWKWVKRCLLIVAFLIVAFAGYLAASGLLFSDEEDQSQQPVRQEAIDNIYK